MVDIACRRTSRLDRIINTLNISILEKRKEIGILLAVGWRKKKIQKLIFYESLIIAVAGWAGGVILGFSLLKYFRTFRWLQDSSGAK